MPFGKKKLDWCGYPTVKKNLMIFLFVLTEFTNVTDTQTDRQTDRQTPHDDIGRACIASRGKNQKPIESSVFAGGMSTDKDNFCIAQFTSCRITPYCIVYRSIVFIQELSLQ